ncbi:MAG: hypothetical protein ABSD47_20995 [Candidatus Methylomirabilota bacterium]|jgi:hypothetical protein
MAPEISRDDQAALDLHKIMLEAMRAREGEILRFAAFLLPALGGIIAFPLVVKVQGTTVPGAPFITTLTVMILLFFGGWYALALSYNYRYLKIVVCRLQHVLSLNSFLPTEWRKGEGKWAKIPRGKLLLFGFAPEIFRALVLLFVVLILFIGVAFVFGISMQPFRPECWERITVSFATVLALGMLEVLGAGFYPGKLGELEK